ncbi:hypothetical protein F2Q69_00058144 [Brassica cretica]|uniref:Uncharacterized protein n=1 Tax=Brassica cretica TaxID=69181 RepID=A0A8S9RPE7_BRACR|nr:hypothetical protein F2Q69_00058144 [Brassica cretica]
MDTAQGVVLIYQLDQTEVFMSDHASLTASVSLSNHSVHADHNFPSDRADQTVRTVPSNHPDCTARTARRIDPQTSGLEPQQDLRPNDRIDRTGALLSRPVCHFKINGQGRIDFERVDFESVCAFFLWTSLDRTGNRTDGLIRHFDQFMNFDHLNFSKARILKFSDDLDSIWPRSVREFLPSGSVDCPGRVLLLSAGHAAGYTESGKWKLKGSFASQTPFSLQVKRLFLVGPVRHIRQQVEFCFLVEPVISGDNQAPWFDDDEKWVRSGDRPFTKAKGSNCDVFDQNELQTYVSLEKMLHKAIHAIRQLKKKENTNTSPAPKQQSNFSSLSNSDLKTNVLSLIKAKRPLVTLENENVQTEPEKEDSLPIFDDFTYEPMEGLDEEQICGHQANQEESSSIQNTDRTQGEHCADYGSFAYNPFPFNVSDLRTNLFEEERNDVPRFVDQSIGTNQHGDQDVLNNLTEVRSSDRTDQTDRAVPHESRLELRLKPRPYNRTDRTGARLSRPTRHSKTHGQARVSLGREETEDGHTFSSGGPSRQSRKRPYLYPVHPSDSDEPGHYLKGHL